MKKFSTIAMVMVLSVSMLCGCGYRSESSSKAPEHAAVTVQKGETPLDKLEKSVSGRVKSARDFIADKKEKIEEKKAEKESEEANKSAEETAQQAASENNNSEEETSGKTASAKKSSGKVMAKKAQTGAKMKEAGEKAQEEAQAEAEAQAQAEAEAQAQAEAEQKAQEEAQAQAEAEQKAQEEAQAQAEAEQKAQEEEKEELVQEIKNLLEDLSGSFDENDPYNSIAACFAEGTSQEDMDFVLTRVSDVLRLNKANMGITILDFDDSSVTAMIYEYDQDVNDAMGIALAFAREGDKLVFSSDVYGKKCCQTCGGSGQTAGEKIACGICGGTGQQYIPNLYYDCYAGWYGGYICCSGCGGAGYTQTTVTCPACNGWGI